MADATPVLLLSLAALASALACIVGDERGRRAVVYVCKPLTMLFILTLAWAAPGETPAAYRNLVLAGLVFSLAGDVFLMLPGDRFVQGLASFLVGHLLYIAAFASDLAGPVWGAGVGFALLGAGFYTLLLPHLGSLRLPVGLYTTAIVAMAWLATARALGADGVGPQFACVGAGLFVASDAALAWNRFRAPLPHSPWIVLGTYFPAQWLIALSLGGGVLLAQ